MEDPHNGTTCWLVSGLASRQSVTPEWRPQGQCPDWTRQVFYVRAPTQEPRWRNKFQKLCSCLRELLLPPGVLSLSCVLSWSHFLLCRGCAPFSWLPSVGADTKTEHFRWQPPSTYAVTEHVASYTRGNAGMPTVLCTVQFLSAFSPSSILASACWALLRPSRERRRYHSLCSSVFPVPSARRGITSCSRLSPKRSPSQLFSSASPYRSSRHAVAAAARDRHCGVFRHVSLGLCSS